MICLKTKHSTIECSLHNHFTICHSKAYSVEQCEYNLVNIDATPVRQIHPENSYQDYRNGLNNISQHDDIYEDRYNLDWRDNPWPEDNRRNDNDHG